MKETYNLAQQGFYTPKDNVDVQSQFFEKKISSLSSLWFWHNKTYIKQNVINIC